MGKNRTSFKKGEIHNPKGAPKRDWTWSGELQKAAEEVVNGQPIKQAMAKSMVRETLKGNVNAFNAVANRMEGMPKQGVDAEVIIRSPGVWIPKEDSE